MTRSSKSLEGSLPKLVTLVALLASLLGCATGDDPRFSTATLAIVNVTLVEAEQERLIVDQSLVFSGDEILYVGPASDLRLPEAAQIVDGTGLFAVPGLWDMHVHAVGDVDDAYERVFPLLIANGVTGIREMGMTIEQLRLLRARQSEPDGDATPRLYVAGPLLDGVKLPWYGDLPLLLETPEAVEPALTELRSLGVDFFKTYDGLSEEVFQAIVDLAAEWQFPVSGHIPKAVEVVDAARAGQHTIEHIDISFLRDCVENWQEWYARSVEARFGEESLDGFHRVNRDFWEAIDWQECDTQFSVMAEVGAYFTPTLTMVLQDRSRVDAEALPFQLPGGREWCSQLLEGIDAADEVLREEHYGQVLQTVARIRQAGVRILAGSDSENHCLAPGFSLHWELARLAETGMSPGEILHTATAVAAQALGLSDRSGRLAPGYWADAVLLSSNPLETVEVLGSPAGVVTRGRYLPSSVLAESKAQILEALADTASTTTAP